MYNTLLTEKQNQTLIITLNRPKVLNALNQELMGELHKVIQALQEDDEVKGAIIRGAGDKAFAAGADISGFPKLDASEGEAFSTKGQKVFWAIENSKKPIIAAVNGYALGGGCELAMSCHIRVAAENAKFGQPEVNLGLIAGYGGTQRLVQLVGKGKATELLITAQNIDAGEALELGLVNYVTTQVELIAKCQEILAKAYKRSPLAVALTLNAISAGVNGNDGYTVEAWNFGQSLESADGREGVSAFLEKRKPNFTGK